MPAPGELKIATIADTPCNAELNAYTTCVQQHPKGLKETDCEDIKAIFKKSMDIYDFAPLFTLQRNLISQEKQMEVWASILLKSDQFHFRIENPIFENIGVKRRMSPELFHAFGNWLSKKGLGEFSEDAILFYRKSISGWALQLHEWAINNGKLNTVESLLSLVLEYDEFRNVPIELIHSAARHLQTSMNKCEIFEEQDLLDMSHIARFVCEVSIESGFPPKVFACAMKYFFVFKEFTHCSSNELILGITCLLLSVKANESVLNSMSNFSKLSNRTVLLLENSVRSILAYSTSGGSVDAETFCQLSKQVKDSVARSELTLLRIIGNSLDVPTQCSSSWGSAHNIAILLRQYSSPTCLNT